ncbi:MAG: hypothetical protein DRJ03_19490 [Chloroflexi bacterium]|nr:MAG: hypothetical protein DRJ03_19490 [Chloroflexota bacterium]
MGGLNQFGLRIIQGGRTKVAKTIYVLIGPQGSGKTHWAMNVLLAQARTPIVRVSQDKQGGREHHRRRVGRNARHLSG